MKCYNISISQRNSEITVFMNYLRMDVTLNTVRTHPEIPGIYSILIPLLESSGIVFLFEYTPGKPH